MVVDDRDGEEVGSLAIGKVQHTVGGAIPYSSLGGAIAGGEVHRSRSHRAAIAHYGNCRTGAGFVYHIAYGSKGEAGIGIDHGHYGRARSSQLARNGRI